MLVKSHVKDYTVSFTDNFAESIREQLKSDKCYFIVDKKVFSLYEDKLSFLGNEKAYYVEAMEENKTLAECTKIIKFLLSEGFKRNYKIVAIGGGITQDLTCFVASVLFRGATWVLYPTTLLAQCDSCIGSKSSINVSEYKNQVGTFYPPDEIFIDVGFLDTLSNQEMRSGVGESIKVHFLDEDRNYSFIINNYEKCFSDREVLKSMIIKSLEIKKKIIEIDEYDRNYRNILNYGHTFGHALEVATNYSVPHGIAVSAGIGMANHFSLRMGLLSKEDYDLMRPTLIKNIAGFEENLSNVNYDALFESLKRDKKNIDNKVGFILTEGPGRTLKQFHELKKETKDLIYDSLASIIR